MQGQRKIFGNRGQRGQKIIVVAYEKAEGRGKNHQVSESRSAEKTECGEDRERDYNLFFMLEKTGGDKAPDLRKNYRRCKENTADQRELQIKKNPSWYEVKIREVPFGSTLVKGLKSQTPMGSM